MLCGRKCKNSRWRETIRRRGGARAGIGTVGRRVGKTMSLAVDGQDWGGTK